MEEDVIDDTGLVLSRKSRLPGRGFFVPPEYEADKRAQLVRRAVTGAETVVIADPDADGLACAAVIRAVRGDAALVPTEPNELAETLELTAATVTEPLELFVCDLVPDAPESVTESLTSLVELGVTIRWCDHHQWPDAVAEAVRGAGVELTIGDGERECSADVLVRALPESVPEHLAELAVVTRDHDLWQKTDPRSDDLADYAYWTDPEQYVETILEHGPDFPAAVDEFLAERREEKQALIEYAVDRATFETVGDLTVGVTYGRCSQNEVADRLRTQGADAAVVVKPAGSASLRGSETFERCHQVARHVNGGGHPQAAGCKPAIYEDMLDYAHHWVTEGEVAKRTILDAFDRVLVK